MKARSPDLDVVVVGAGPAGCECARRLAQGGFSVVVAEEHARAGEPLHCTGIISAQACQAFDLPGSAVECELEAAELTSPGGITLHVDLNGARPYVVDRRQVDGALASRAHEVGVTFCYSTRVEELDVDRWGVTLAGTSAGESWQVRARAAVLAGGAKSGLPRQVGLASCREAMHGAQAEVAAASLPTMRAWVGQQLVPGGFGWVVPARSGQSRVGVLTQANPREALLRIARKALDGRGERLAVEPIRVHPIPVVPRRPTTTDRVLSVGDAAGQVKMTTGGGVYYGLLGARIASEVLDEALTQDRLSLRHLARYETLWQQVLGPEQRAGQMLRRVASRVPDETLDEIFRSAEARGLSRHLVELLDFDWHAQSSLWLALRMLATVPGNGLSLLWLKRLGA